MSNSPLVSCTVLSPNCSPRTGKIDRISIHHAAGVGSAESIGRNFETPVRQASSNYGIGNDGRIGLYVPEDKMAWTSSCTANDDRAVTIEVSNSDIYYPYPVSGAAYQSLIDLCVDICRRNGIKRMIYTRDTSGNLTAHRWFAATQCPGDYLYERFPAIADAVNKILEEDDMITYKTLNDVPDSFRPTIQKLLESGAIVGEKDPDPTRLDDNILNVSYDFCRTMTTLDRLGKLD